MRRCLPDVMAPEFLGFSLIFASYGYPDKDGPALRAFRNNSFERGWRIAASVLSRGYSCQFPSALHLLRTSTILNATVAIILWIDRRAEPVPAHHDELLS